MCQFQIKVQFFPLDWYFFIANIEMITCRRISDMSFYVHLLPKFQTQRYDSKNPWPNFNKLITLKRWFPFLLGLSAQSSTVSTTNQTTDGRKRKDGRIEEETVGRKDRQTDRRTNRWIFLSFKLGCLIHCASKSSNSSNHRPIIQLLPLESRFAFDHVILFPHLRCFLPFELSPSLFFCPSYF